jgi:hypothetical protein
MSAKTVWKTISVGESKACLGRWLDLVRTVRLLLRLACQIDFHILEKLRQNRLDNRYSTHRKIL